MAKTVLVVDDNSDELMIYSTLLRHAGYDILVTDDADTAIRLASERQPDLALIDLQLQCDKDGCDVIEALRLDPRTCTMPVIVNTAFADLYQPRLRNSQVDAVLQKPIDCEQLLDLVLDRLGPEPNCRVRRHRA
jgi:two-component system cell cycle response regulator DivK